jgi:hypothetical protein
MAYFPESEMMMMMTCCELAWFNVLGRDSRAQF